MRQQYAHEAVVTMAPGHLVGPDGRTSEWRLIASQPSAVRPAEVTHAARLATT